MKQRWRCIHARTIKTNAYFFRWSMVIMSTTQRGALCRESACSRSNHQRNDIISPKLPCCRRDEDALPSPLPSRCSIFGSDFRDFIKKIEKNTDTRAACGRFQRKKIPTNARRAGVFMTKREFSLDADEFHTKLRDVRRSTRARSEAVDRSRCDYLSQRCGSASRRLTAQRARNLRSNQPVARRASFTSIEARRLRPAVHRGALDSRVEMTDKISFHIAQASGVREARPSTRKRA